MKAGEEYEMPSGGSASNCLCVLKRICLEENLKHYRGLEYNNLLIDSWSPHGLMVMTFGICAENKGSIPTANVTYDDPIQARLRIGRGLGEEDLIKYVSQLQGLSASSLDT
uniref:Uncharacterized protein n=1 Tax=Glossina palpalis gambiensis TaxID=67801 RepID=A0A1B0ALZ3_9MUSC